MKQFTKTDRKEESIRDFIARTLNCSRNEAKRLLDERRVFVNGRRVWMARHRLKQGDTIEIQDTSTSPRTLTTKQVLYQDDHFVILNKPPRLLSNGPDSAESELRRLLNIPALRAVHRLDRDTSGCLLFATSRDVFERMVPLFKERAVGKAYRALVSGRVSGESARIAAPIDGQPALSLLRVLSSTSKASHLEIKIETGRTHQVRKHLAGIGHPILGDKQYATGKVDSQALRSVPRQMLHAHSLSFPCPMTGEVIRTKATLPEDFSRVMKRMKLK